jgi:hypothetical protein
MNKLSYVLNHELIIISEEYAQSELNEFDVFSYNYDFYKCIKCSQIIIYYKFGGFFWKKMDNYKGWMQLELTCEEDIIKGIIE